MNTLVNLSDIYKSYPGKNVLNGINLRIQENEIHGFLGPNGAGKSTLMNIILGLLESDTGKVELKNGLKIGYLPENAPLYPEMRVRDYLKFVQNIYSFPDRVYLDKIIARLGLVEFENKLIEHLSKGYKQRVALAAAICHNPTLLILDEPMVGLDPHAIIQMKDLILDLSKDHTVFISSHQLYDLSQMCNVLSIINEGVIVKHGPQKDIENDVRESQLIEIELENENEQIIKKMCEEHHLSYKSVSKNKYQIASRKNSDIRSVISHYLMDHRVAIISLKEQELNLEEIFRKVTVK